MIPTRLNMFTSSQPVLDQGFVRLVSVDGDDERIVTAARVTTGKGVSVHKWGPRSFGGEVNGVEVDHAACRVCEETVQVASGDDLPTLHCIEGDRALLRYMMRHRHTSPYEFAEITLHLRLPMDAWRQMVRHRTASVQEYSTRYSEAIDAMAVTAPDAWRAQSGSNRQGSSGTVTEWPEGYAVDDIGGEINVRSPAQRVSEDAVEGMGTFYSGPATPGAYLSARESELHDLARDVYAERLAFGVAFEQARKELPLSNYTEVYWKIDLHNLLHFLSLRLDPHAQLEIRAYANVIWHIVRTWVPLAAEAFEDYKLYAYTLSRMEVDVMRAIVADWLLDQHALAEGEGREKDFDPGATLRGMVEAHGARMGTREVADFLKKFLP